MEEILIALRDDRQHLFEGQVWMQADELQLHSQVSLYPDGFDAVHFLNVVLSQAVWGER